MAQHVAIMIDFNERLLQVVWHVYALAIVDGHDEMVRLSQTVFRKGTLHDATPGARPQVKSFPINGTSKCSPKFRTVSHPATLNRKFVSFSPSKAATTDNRTHFT
jgi:hypothetical protein